MFSKIKPKIKKIYSFGLKHRRIVFALAFFVLAAAVFGAVKLFYHPSPKIIQATMSAEDIAKYPQTEIPAEAVFEAPQKDFRSGEAAIFKIKIPQNIPEKKADNNPAPAESQPVIPENTSQNNPPQEEQPADSDDSSYLPAEFQKLLGIEKAYAQQAGQIVRTEVIAPDGKITDIVPVIQESSGSLDISVPQPKDKFWPGNYKLKVYFLVDNQIVISTQDFGWGVLAINTNKSVYTPGEEAKLAMAVLDEGGNMVCNAKVTLDIRKPDGTTDTLSAENGKITVNEECQSHDFTLTPDYEARYTASNSGVYSLTLTAETEKGTHSITDQFEIKNSVPFDVERVTATRIYPPENYPVMFNITANEDFKGEIRETVPADFEIFKGAEEYKPFDSESANGNLKTLTWNVSIKKGEKLELGYEYKAPKISPQFYLLGPLIFNKIGILGDSVAFEESRQWQIAADQVATGIIIGWPSTAGNIPSGWQRVTALDAKYLPGSTTAYGGTGGAATHTHTYTNASHTHTVNHTHTLNDLAQSTSGTATSGTSTGGSRSTHLHTTNESGTPSIASNNAASPSFNGASNDPLYLDVIWIESLGTTDIPNGAVVFFNGNLPGSWNRTAANGFLRGAAAAGDGGGTGGTSNAHTHTDSGHTHTENGHTHTATTNGGTTNASGSGTTGTISASAHTHSITGASTTATETSGVSTVANGDAEPPWKKLTIMTNATGGATLPENTIAIWDGTTSNIPQGWVLCDGNNGTPALGSTTFIKGANTDGEVGNTGGATSHSHAAGTAHTHTTNAHTHTWTVANNTSPATVTSGNRASSVTAHNHPNATQTSTTPNSATTGNPNVAVTGDTSTGETRPSYTEVLYIQYKGKVTVGATGTQATSVIKPSSNNYIGGAFTFIRDYSTSANVTSIKISEKGTINANANLSNLKLYYETSADCTRTSPTQFGTGGASFNASDEATITGTMAVSNSQICLYADYDVGSGASAGDKIDFEITVPTTDVIVSAGGVAPATAVQISGDTTVTAAPTITVSGGCFTDATEGTPCTDDANTEIKVAVNGTVQSASAADADGSWNFTIDQPANGAVMVFYVNGAGSESVKATTVTKYDNSGNVDLVKMYQGQLVIGTDSGSANSAQTVSIADLNTTTNGFEYSDDPDVIFDVTAGDDLTLDPNPPTTTLGSLYIIGTNTYQPASGGGGDSTAQNVYIEGTLTPDSNTINIYGNYTNAGNYLDPSAATLDFKGTGTQILISGGTGVGEAFGNVTHSGAGTLQLATNDVLISGNFLQSAGTFDCNGLGIGFMGDFQLNSGTTWTKGAITTFMPSGTKNFYDNTSGQQDLGVVETFAVSSSVVTLQTAMKVTTLKIVASTTLDANGQTITILGSGTAESRPFIVEGSFTETSSTVKFTGTTDTDIEAETYNNLELKPSGGTNPTYTLLGGGTPGWGDSDSGMIEYHSESTYNDQAYAIVRDSSSGDIYVAGHSLTASQGWNFRINKYNANGDICNATNCGTGWGDSDSGSISWDDGGSYNDDAYAIALDTSGNIYVAGNSTSADADDDFRIVKFNANGDICNATNCGTGWGDSDSGSITYNSSGSNTDNIEAIIVDASGNIYVAGWTENNSTLDKQFRIHKYNSSGDIASGWGDSDSGMIVYGNASYTDAANGLALDASSGDLYVAGTSQTATDQNFRINKYNSNGDICNASNCGTGWGDSDSGSISYNSSGTNLDRAFSVALDASDNIYVAGDSNNGGAQTAYNFQIAKFNSNGDICNASNCGTGWGDSDSGSITYNSGTNIDDEAKSIALSTSGEIYVAGYSGAIPGNYDFRINKYDANGDIATGWGDTDSGSISYNHSGAHDYARSVQVDASNNIYVAGYVSAGSEGDNFHIHKYDSNGDISAGTGAGSLATQNLTIGDGTNDVTVNADTNDPDIDIGGNLTLADGTTLTTSDTGDINLAGNLQLNSTSVFSKSTGTGTLIFDGTSQTITDSNSPLEDLGVVSIGPSTTTSVSTSGNVTLTKLTIGDNDTFDISSDTLTITGSGVDASRPLVHTTGTFTINSSTVKFTGTEASTIQHATYNNLELSPSGGTNPTYTLAAATSQTITTQNLTIGDGANDVTVTAATNAPNIDINGDFLINNHGTFTENSGSAKTIKIGTSGTTNGDFTLESGSVWNDGTAWLYLDGGSDANMVYINDKNTSKQNLGTLFIGDTTAVVSASSNLAASSLDVNTGSKFYARGYDLDLSSGMAVNGTGTLNCTDTLAGDGTDIYVGTAWNVASGATFTADEDPAKYTDVIFDGGTADSIVPGGTDENHDFYNLTFSKTSTMSSMSLQGDVHIENDLSIGSNSDLDIFSTESITLGGDWTNSGAFTPSSGTVIFDAPSGTQLVNAGGEALDKAFYNLTHSGAGTLELTSTGIDVNGAFQNTAGTFNCNGQNQNFAGSFSLTDGTTYTSGGTLTFDGTSTYTDSNTDAKENIGTVTVNAIGSSVTLGSSMTATKINITGGALNLASSGYTLLLTGFGTGTSRPLRMNGGTLTEGTNSTVKFTGTDASSIDAEAYYNLELSPSGGANPAYTLLGGTSGWGNDDTGIITYNSGGSRNDASLDSVLDASGNLYVVGTITNGSGNGDWHIRKYNSSGDIATGWGDTDSGAITYDSGTAFSGDVAYAIAIDNSTGAIYVGGYINGGGANSGDCHIRKYDSNGDLASSWGDGGNGTITFSAGDEDYLEDIIFDSGNIYTAQKYNSGLNEYSQARKYTSSGVLDTSWGDTDSGIITRTGDDNGWYSIGIDGSSNIYLAGNYIQSSAYTDWRIYKYDANGDLATSWGDGGNGYINYNSGSNTDDSANSIAVKSTGVIYVAGTAGIDSNYYTDWHIHKYTSGGVLDTTWGDSDTGMINYDSGSNNTKDTPKAVKFDSSDNIYVAGLNDSTRIHDDFQINKYDASGDLASGWGDNDSGMIIYNTGGSGTTLGLSLDASGNIFVNGWSVVGSNANDWRIHKYDSNGDLASGTSNFTTQNLTIGDGTNAVTVTAATNNPAMDLNGDFVLNKKGAFTAGSADITIGTDGTTNGDFTLEYTDPDGSTWTKGSGKLILDGGDDSNLVYFNDKNPAKQDLGTVQIGASPATTNLSSDMSATNLTISAGDRLNTRGYDITLTGYLTCNGTLNVNDTVELDDTDISLGGNFTMDAGGTYTDEDYDSEIIFTGNASADQAFATGGKTYGSITLNNNQATYDDIDVSGNLNISGSALTITDGNLDLDANDPTTDVNGSVSIGASGTFTASASSTLSVFGNWTNAGTFTSTGSSVTFDGSAAQTITSGGASFNNVTFSNSLGSSPNINYTGALTIGGTTTLSNATNIASTDNTAITFSGTINGAQVLSINSGSGAVTFSGIIGGSTPITSLASTGSGAVAINTTGITTRDVASNNVSFTGAVTLGADLTITTNNATNDGNVILSSTLNSADATDRAFTIVAGSGDATISGAAGATNDLASITIGANDITVASIGGGASGVTGATAITGDASGTITLTGTTYNTAGTQAFNAGGAARTITLNEGATFTTTDDAITFTGVVDSQAAENNSITLNAGTAQVTFNNNVGASQSIGTLTKQGSGDVLFGASTLTATGLTLSAGTINNAATDSGVWTVSGNVLISAGTLKATTNTFNVGGNWTNSDTFTANGGTVVLNGTGAQTLSGTMTTTSAFNSLTITNTFGVDASDDDLTDFSPGIIFSDDATSTGTYTITTEHVRIQYTNTKNYIFNDINWNGQATDGIYFRNSDATGGSHWNLSVTGTQTAVEYINVSHSDAETLGGDEIIAATGCSSNSHDGGDNHYWVFSAGGSAVEFVSIVDPGNGSGTDYTSLSAWNTGVSANLTATTTKVFAGTENSHPSDDTPIFLCDSSNTYRGESGTVVHSKSSQIMVDGITNGVAEASTDYWYSTDTCGGGTKYFTLNAACGNSPIAVAKLRTSNGAADTTAVTISNWTTSATNYIKIWTDPSEPYRHQGKWDESKYRIEVTNNHGISISEDYVRLDGLQVKVTAISNNSNRAINVDTVSAGSNELQVSNSILRGSMSGTANANQGIGTAANSSVSKVWNNVIYDWGIFSDNYGIGIYGGTAYIYNNTFTNNDYGIYVSSGTAIAKNNIANDNTTDYSGTFDSASTYNITNDTPSSAIAFGASADTGTTDGASANKLIDSDQNFLTTVKVGMIVKDSGTNYSYVTAVDNDGQLSLNDDIMGNPEVYTIYTNMYGNVTFEDETNDDFHLDSSDTVAKDKGTILYDSGDDANLNFTTDIDNNARLDSATKWDVGADENIAKIYRSVGPSATTALTTGKGPASSQYQANHLTISGLYATFELPLPDNVGVGDAVEYDSDNNGSIDAIMLIDKRLSAQKYRVKAASGAVPTAMSVADIDWSIFRAYTALHYAESDSSNADENNSIADAVENFDDWSSGQDLVTAQKQWNIAAYANSTTADSTAVVLNGWTTSADSYIKIYTPTRIDEVGASQRHSGVWDDNKYKLEVTGATGIVTTNAGGTGFARIDGLQIKVTAADSSNRLGIFFATSGSSYASNNIVRGVISGTSNNAWGLAADNAGTGTLNAYFWNNIVYDFINGSNYCIGITANNIIGGFSGTVYAYNNTLQNNYNGIVQVAGTLTAKNNIVKGSGDANTYIGSFTSSDYNATDSTDTDDGGGNSHISHTFSFVDESGDNFHLVPSDTGGKNLGTDLTNNLNLNFNTDIDSYGIADDTNKTRPYNTTWDIGADEVITPIYRSVAPEADGNLAALATGADNHLNISGSTATFDSALPDNVGVGDALEYDDDNNGTIDGSDSMAFITARTDSTHYTIKTSTGGVPTAPSAADEIHWNINRAYTSLSNAEAGTENENIDSDLRNFDAGDRDIKANSEQWNIACYANGTAADAAAATQFSGWTTAPQNYMRVYAPVSTSEVGTSQRHQGKWDSNKYYISGTGWNPFEIRVNYFRVDGIQITMSDTGVQTGITINSLSTNPFSIYLSNNIVRATVTASSNGYGINLPDATSENQFVYVWNNLVYGHTTVGIRDEYNGHFYIYGNTSVGNGTQGFGLSGSNSILKNNLAQGNATNDFSVYSTYWNGDCANNASGDTTAPGTNSHISHTFTFEDATNKDYHLDSADVGAKDLGADLSQDPIWQTYMSAQGGSAYGGGDIDGASHPLTGSGLTTDIGADEVATPIYRSIAPSATSALATGAANHLNISGSTATFDTAPGTSIGVGDALEYDANNSGAVTAIAFITGRTSETVYTIKSAVGGAPVAQTATDEVHWNIFRASSSLPNAEAGIENSGLTDAVQNFDDWTVGGAIDADETGRDIWTNNEQWNITAYANGTTADSENTIFNGWTSYPQNFLNIYTPTAATEVGTSQMHSGKWDTSKYHLESADRGIDIRTEFMRINGLQVKITNASSNFNYGIYGSYFSAPGDIRISNNIIQGVLTGTSNDDYGLLFNDADIKTIKIWNNIIYGFSNGAYSGNTGIAIDGSGLSAYLYNNTVYGNYNGISTSSATTIAKNNISYNNTDNYVGSFDAAGTNNLSGPGTDAQMPATNAQDGVTVNFVDEAGKDFHLDPTDIGARNEGTDLSADANLPVTTDIDGKARPNQGIFDIGADEAAKGIYYSVGQNVTDHGSGGNMTIASGIATFTVAQTATNLGVGDKVTYNTSSIAYLLRKVDTTHWYIVTATGAIPGDDPTPRTVDSITHTFNALAEAEDHADDADYMNATDLAANDFQLNIPCYNDAGAADTTAVTVSGYTTGPSNFIKVYTPVSTTTEANTRQRHWGKWDATKYRLEVATANMFTIGDKYVKADGLQIQLTDTVDGTGTYITGQTGSSEIGISNSIYKGILSGSAASRGILVYDTSATVKIWNNIFYDWINSTNDVETIRTSGTLTGNVYLYNNTFQNNYYGVYRNAGTIIVKNNLFASNTTDASGTITDTYNATTNDNTKGLSAGGTGNRFSQTFSFLDATNKDFHLVSTDAGAKNYGANLSADSSLSFSTDIDGNGRSFWDIGADEGSVEMNATVMASSGDYSSLSGWQTGMVTDLTSTGTMVFSGTKTLAINDDASVTLYRGGVSQAVTATVVHSTATQILLESISSPTYVMAASDVWRVDENNFFTISTAGGDPAIAVAKIDGAWTGADTSAVTISGWETGPTNYIKVYTAAAARHPGKWDETKYRMDVESMYGIQNYESFVRIEGIQIKSTYTTANTPRVILNREYTGTVDTRISHSIIVGNFSGGATAGNGIELWGAGSAWNNIIYNVNGAGLYGDGQTGSVYFYNNTIYNSGTGIQRFSGTVVAKNNIAYNNTDNYSGTFDASGTNNLSGPGTDADMPATNKQDGVPVSFVNANKQDFHIASDDTGAKNNGILLYDSGDDANLNFTTDIDGSSRQDAAGTWDIGADEAATQIYYSVGQNTSNNETGAGNVTVDASARTATFTVEQIATNMGVGDVIDYDADNKICYITEKVSTYVWKCQSVTGGAPTAATGVAVNSIHHTFQYLVNAEDDSDDAGYLNTANLVTGNYVLNIPCYYDTGPDQNAVTIGDWTTGHANYIKIYTPNDTTKEVNQSQRHSGKLDTAKWNLEASAGVINIADGGVNYVQLEGLQLLSSAGNGQYSLSVNLTGLTAGDNDVQVSNSLFKATLTGTGYATAISTNTDTNMKAWNNIIYDYNVSGSYGIYAYGTAYVYNNTLIDCTNGIRELTSGGVMAKNNIVKGSGNTNAYDGSFATGTDYNATDGTDDIGKGTHNRISQTFTFIDETGDNFHIAFADTGAKGYGTNLKDDANLAFSDDVDSQERTGNWTIGADEPKSEAEIQSNTQKVQSLTDGLVLYQSFDGMDINGNTAYDRSGQSPANNGTISGATPTRGRKGQALVFDGNEGNVSINDSTSLSSATGAGQARTWAYWIYFKNDANKLITDKSTFDGVSLWSEAQTTYIKGGVAQTGAVSSSTLTANTWYHVAFTYDGANTRLYIDGSLDAGPSAQTAPADDSHVLFVGGTTGFSNSITSTLDEFRVYNRALSADEVGDLYRLGEMEINTSQTPSNKSGLTGMWSFDGPDISGTIAYDRSGNGNNGTINGATPTRGKKGQGLSFNGTSDYVSVADNSNVQQANVRTVSFWINPNDLDNIYPRLIDETESAGVGWRVVYNHPGNADGWNQRSIGVTFNGDHGKMTPTNSINETGKWYNIVVTMSDTATISHIYINDVDQTIVTGPLHYLAGSSTQFNIGSRTDPTRWFNGKMDEVRIYNRELSSDEVGDLYRLGQATLSR